MDDSRDSSRGGGSESGAASSVGATGGPTASNTDQKSHLIAPPAISLPKGGGAIRSIGEKFAANPVTGTGSMSVPITTSPGRSGFGPQLSVTYDSGSGNGPFGFGWNLSLPAITRKTDKGLPRYHDVEESDVFILSGAEDLVPVLVQNAQGEWERENLPLRSVGQSAYRVDRYRPRIEGLFARIERWTNIADTTDIFWRSISKDNITSWYGKTDDSRIADPTDTSHIFGWLISQSHDDKGNVIVYGYRSEDSVRIFEDASGNPQIKTHERNRTDTSRSAQRYLKRIRYGNRLPYFPVLAADAAWPEPPDATALDGSNSWHFEVVLDYGEHDKLAPKPARSTFESDWPCRADPFSSYRAGFEVRTYRICQRVLMFHHFPDEEEVGADCLVRSTDFDYSYEQDPSIRRDPVYTFLCSVTQNGYRREGDGYIKRSLPPVEFEYTQPVVQDTVEDVDPASLDNLPVGVDGVGYQWTDLHGEGIPGVLTEQGATWFYKRNLSPISSDQGVELAPMEQVALKPNVALAAGAQFMDLAGDGQSDLVMLDGPAPGLYEHDTQEGWQSFRPFTSCLNRNTRDPNLKLVDLDGDGHADVLITEDDALVWHASLAEAGFGPARRVAQQLDEEKGPRLVFADASQSIYLADLSGDGLTDLVRIRNGEVCYWPNLGYGRFGAKVTMDHAPWFDNPEQFDQQRIRLADIDGTGTTDIIYLNRDGVHLYFNQSGNGWNQAQPLAVFPRVDNLVSIMPADLLGNGTACLVWSSPLSGDGRRPMRYVNLMGRQKPHLLVRTINNLGAETRVAYAPSTKFYLQDKRDGKPWITRLPFPVHVVEQVETRDRISGNRFVSRYAYHHGYFDGEEREFRGFGMVEQWDTEEIAALSGTGQTESSGDLESFTNLDAASYVPPVHTKTWFHTGAYLGHAHISRQHACDYYGAPKPDTAQYQAHLDTFIVEALLPDTLLPNDLSAGEEREACRALKGSMLRQEVYAEDGSAKATHPYVVTEQNFSVRRLQPTGENRHAVFFTHPREAISHHSERNPYDPRITHALTLEVDSYGNVLKEAAIGYGRAEKVRVIDEDGTSTLVDNRAKDDLDDTDPAKSGLTKDDWDRQCLIHITYTENQVTNAIGEPPIPGVINQPPEYPDAYRTPLPCRTRTYELRKAEQDRSPANQSIQRFSFDEISDRIASAADGYHDIAYEDMSFAAAQQAVDAGEAQTDQSWRRLIEEVRIRYRPGDLGASVGDDPVALLPLGELDPLALPGETYKLAFTPGLLTEHYAAKMSPTNLTAILHQEGGYVDLDQNGHEWIPSGRMFFSVDASHTSGQELAMARQHYFVPQRFQDPFGQITTVGYDTHQLLVERTTDALGNLVQAQNDYRVLQPALLTDPNGNRSQVAVDSLGMVVGTAVMGKFEEQLGDSLDGLNGASFEADLSYAEAREHLQDPLANPHTILGRATTRLVYDLFAYHRTKQQPQPEPPVVYSLARETHVSELGPDEQPRIQHAFSYSDGFGREIQKKVQAEPGPVPQRAADGQILHDACGCVLMTDEDMASRWVASGWTIFNNKGKPVRQYEPFFSPDHGYEFGVRAGVSPILFYDALSRVVATLHPNHSWEKVVFDPWRQDTWDVNDTLLSDPQTDDDVKGFFVQPNETTRLDEEDYLPLWYGLRTDPEHAARLSTCYPDERLRDAEIRAANQAAAHAGSPSTAHLDALGRPFLTIARNRVQCAEHALNESEAAFATRVNLDIEGNQRAVVDAKDRIVMRYAYDLLGNRIHQISMEAGARWMLNDVAGKPIRAWDSRGFQRRLEYDPLRRPTALFVSSAVFIESHGREEIQAERTVYGETLPNPEQTNHRGKVYQVFDDAGIVSSLRYDFKGNLLEGRRQLRQEYKKTSDWRHQEVLEDERFDSRSWYDAMNRPIQSIAPRSDREGSHYNIARHGFNEAGLLERVDVWNNQATKPDGLLDPESADLHAVTNIDYDAKGQRTRIAYGNGTVTTYSYDPLTFRLTNLKTTRQFTENGCSSQLFSTPTRVQDLSYTYDPAGNITRIADGALKTITNGQTIEPISTYTYDAVYRLIEASGREHVGQTAFALAPSNGNYRDYPFAGAGNQTCDPQGLRRYTERYHYDAVGNFLEMQHRRTDATQPGWARAYVYDETSLIEDGNNNTPLQNSNRLSRTILHPNGTQLIAEKYLHDAHGNMIQMPHLPLMEWDFNDQLSAASRQVVNNGGTPEITYYVYDAAGQRVRKVTERHANGEGTPTGKNERIYLGGFENYREYDGGGQNHTKERESLHIVDDKQRIALVETATLGAESAGELGMPVIRYQLGNHLGSVSLELDRDGGLISYEEYHPYGSTAFQAGKNSPEISLKRYRYTGKERDEESGLNYHGARLYALWLGRWCSCDRSSFRHRDNSYAYANNNPARLVDTNGMEPVKRTETEPYASDVRLHLTLPERVQAGSSVGGSSSPLSVPRYKQDPSLQQQFLSNWNELSRAAVPEPTSPGRPETRPTPPGGPITEAAISGVDSAATEETEDKLEKGGETLLEAAGKAVEGTDAEAIAKKRWYAAIIAIAALAANALQKTEVKYQVRQDRQITVMPTGEAARQKIVFREVRTGERQLDLEPSMSLLNTFMGMLPDEIPADNYDAPALLINKSEPLRGEQGERFGVDIGLRIPLWRRVGCFPRCTDDEAAESLVDVTAHVNVRTRPSKMNTVSQPESASPYAQSPQPPNSTFFFGVGLRGIF